LPTSTAVTAEVNPEFATVDHLLLQYCLRLLSGGDVDKIGVREATRLSAAAIDRNSDVKDITDFTEEICGALAK